MSLSSRSSSSGRSSGAGGRSNNQLNGYYAYRHPPSGNGENEISQDQDERKMGSVSVQNGALNLHIPCAFSYAYDVPVPPQPKQPQKDQHQKRPFPSKGRNSFQNQKQLPPTSRVPKAKAKPSGSSSRPFYTTVKGGELFQAKEMPSMGCSSSSRLQNKCSVAWDFSCGQQGPFRVMDYGQELYEQAAQSLAKCLHKQKLADKKSSDEFPEVEDNCYDFSKPGIHSSKQAAKALERAVESLKDVPEEVEAILRKDKRFQPAVLSKATKVLNVSRNSKVYKDLIPVDPNPDVHTETENLIQAEIKKSIEAARLPSRAKDPEPKLDDYQSNSYTRMRPSPVQPPPKPSAGISLTILTDFDTVSSDIRLEAESNKQLSNHKHL